jgi:deoxyribonuclease-4
MPMPLLGAHLSIAGGCHNALLAAQALGCQTLQLFTKNNNQWKAKDLTAEEIGTFRSILRKSRLRQLMAHDCYLINLASPDKTMFRRSLEAFTIELQRAEALGLGFLVMHPGSAVDGDVEAGLKRVAGALDQVHARCPHYRCQVLLENTAGQGNNLGHRFEHLARILALIKEPKRLGVCLDTCHLFAAGYALTPEPAYRATMRAFGKIVGFKWLRAFHLNDSLKPLGSRVDRHAHIGKGCLGLEPFRLLLNDRRFRNRPMVIETPKEGPDGEDMDPVNLGILRGLMAEVRP